MKMYLSLRSQSVWIFLFRGWRKGSDDSLKSWSLLPPRSSTALCLQLADRATEQMGTKASAGGSTEPRLTPTSAFIPLARTQPCGAGNCHLAACPGEWGRWHGESLSSLHHRFHYLCTKWKSECLPEERGRAQERMILSGQEEQNTHTHP